MKAVSVVRKQQHIEYRVPATALQLWLSVHAGGQASQAALDARAAIWSGSYRHWQQLLFQSLYQSLPRCFMRITYQMAMSETTHLVLLASGHALKSISLLSDRPPRSPLVPATTFLFL